MSIEDDLFSGTLLQLKSFALILNSKKELTRLIDEVKVNPIHNQDTENIREAFVVPQNRCLKKVVFFDSYVITFYIINPRVNNHSKETLWLGDSCYS